MARIISIDYGLKRCGLAWTDPNQIIATGIGWSETHLLMDKLIQIVERETIETIVLGYPTKEDGSETHTTAPVLNFKSELEKQFPGIPVILWDERFTTIMAKQAMIQGGLGKKKRREKSLVDEISATMMLQEFLETKL